MRYLGVNYDVGTHFTPGELSREHLDPAVVRYEMRAISEQLHANAVRVSGEPVERLRLTAEAALDAELTVFFSPWKIDSGGDTLLAYLRECAAAAEELRARGEVVFVLGCEFSLFTDGIIPGRTVYERVPWLLAQREEGGTPEPAPDVVAARLDAALRSAAGAVRESFHGRLTYAAGTWEQVDWSLFDIVGLDYYRQRHTDEEYAQGLRDAAAHGKPVAVLEFGCCTYEGAELRGGTGWMILQHDHDGQRGSWENGVVPTRSEKTQADHLRAQLELYAAEHVDGAFVFTFVFPAQPTSDNPEEDYDMAAYSLVKSFPPEDPRSVRMPPWEPKESFHAVSESFTRLSAS